MSDETLFTPEVALDLWYRAAKEELGLTWTIKPDQAEYIRMKMYEARRDIGDPRLKNLSLHTSLDCTTMILYHNDQEALP